jgi:hypothetical protein
MMNTVGCILLWVVLVAGPAFSQDLSSQDLPSGVTFVPDNGVSVEAPANQSATQPAVASQQPAVHPAAIDYGHGYEVRARIHRYASYTTLPQFGAQIIVGQKLRNELDRGENTHGGLKTAHTALATGIVGLFAVNSITGVWNLVESRKDPNNSKLRLAHSIMMLGADAGFVATSVITPGHEHGGLDESHGPHRTIALTSIGVATAAYLMMLIGDH